MSNSELKKERKKQRHIKNILKEKIHKENAWKHGKLIEENHNDGPYSENYTLELSQRLYYIIKTKVIKEPSDNKIVISRYQKLKNKIKDLILHWNPNIDKENIYYYLKKSLEIYWDNTNNLKDFLKNDK